MSFIEWLEQTWVYIVAVIGGISLLWGFNKVLKEIRESIKAPISSIETKVNNIQNSVKVQDEAIKSILMKDLVNLADKGLKQGYMTMDQKKTWYALYKSYKDEHGNSFIDSLKETVDKIEIKEK